MRSVHRYPALSFTLSSVFAAAEHEERVYENKDIVLCTHFRLGSTELFQSRRIMKTQHYFIDLTQRPPRSFRVRLGNYVVLARMLDKGRATLAGKNGEYIYNSSTDQRLVKFLGFDPDALSKELATGKGDGEILEWVQAHSKTPRTPWEIEAWSAFMEKRGLEGDAETLAFFAEYLGKLSKTREDVKTMFEFGELDDYVSFGGKA
jgi:Domain of unknown function (DUF5069)